MNNPPKYHQEYKPGMPIDNLTELIIGIGIEVHKEIGPNFREIYYHRAIELELKRLKIPYIKEKVIDIKFRNKKIGSHKLDLVIDDRIVVELKSCPKINKAHLAQTLTYLRCGELKLGLILNFGKSKLAIKRVIL